MGLAFHLKRMRQYHEVNFELYNQSPVNFSLEPLPSQKTAQGWMLWQAAFGGVVKNVISLTFGSLTPMPPPTASPSPPSTCYRKHENTKKRANEQRVQEIEHGSFTPLVLSATGGMGNAATICYKRLASMIATKHDQSYCSTISWLRCTLSFSLLRSAIQCIRGSHSSGGRAAKQLTAAPY